jgi:hypothetical protein
MTNIFRMVDHREKAMLALSSLALLGIGLRSGGFGEVQRQKMHWERSKHVS